MALRTSDYLLGDTMEELGRLQRQSELFRDPTIEILKRAGLAPGMRVLDVGCGAGDVSLIAAELVGPTGSVVGVDQSAEALATAELRAKDARGCTPTFTQADISQFGDTEDFDAVIGRFILLHLHDPAALLRRLTEPLPGGSVVAFIEMDIRSARAVPGFDLFDQCMGWIVSLYREAGLEPDMGSKLYGAFRAAGMTPELTGSCRLEGGEATTVHDYVTDTIRSVMPRLSQLGIASAEEIEIDTLAERLYTEAVSGDHCFVFPRFIGAWARR